MRPAAGPPPTDIGVQVGLVVAAAKVPETFAPGLATRSVVDQGFVTALSTGVHYLLAVGTQDALQAAAAELARTPAAARWGDPATRQRTLALAMDVAAIPVGLALRRAAAVAPRRSHGTRLGAPGRLARDHDRHRGASASRRARVGLRVLDDRLGADGRVAGLPIAVPLGLTIAVVVDRQRGCPARTTTPTVPQATAVRAVGARGGGGGGRARHRRVRRARSWPASPAGGWPSGLPGGPHLWRLVAHGACLGAARRGRVDRLGAGDARHRDRGVGRGAGVRRRRGRPVDRHDPERRAGQPGAVGHARAGKAAVTCSPTCARPPCPDRPAGASRPVDRDGDG